MAIVHLNEKNFEEEVKKSNIPVLIDFWASWCGPCQMMGPVFEELSGEFEGTLKFAKLSTEDHPEIAQEYAITGIPALLLTKAGEEKDRIVGFLPKEQLKSEIKRILAASLTN